MNMHSGAHDRDVSRLLLDAQPQLRQHQMATGVGTPGLVVVHAVCISLLSL